MTRQQAIDRHIDRIAGMLLDAAVEQRKGADLSVWIRAMYPKLKALIGDVFDDAAEPNTNGHAANGVTIPRRN